MPRASHSKGRPLDERSAARNGAPLLPVRQRGRQLRPQPGTRSGAGGGDHRAVFLTVVRRYHQVRGSAAAWLWAIVRSELARHFRGRKQFVQPKDELPAPDDEPADALVRRETLAKLRLALQQLSEEQRQLIDMKFFLNMRNCGHRRGDRTNAGQRGRDRPSHTQAIARPDGRFETV